MSKYSNRIISTVLIISLTLGIWYQTDAFAKRADFAQKVNSETQTEIVYGEYDEIDREFASNKENLVGLIESAGLADDEDFTFRVKSLFVELYGFLKDIFVQAVEGIMRYQDEKTKMFYQVPNFPGRDGNYIETSGSAMVSYALLKGARLGMLSSDYAQKGAEIFNGIVENKMSAENGDLNLKDICLVAGLGPENNTRRDGSYEYYISEPIVENDAKGVGPFIMAYTEIKKLM